MKPRPTTCHLAYFEGGLLDGMVKILKGEVTEQYEIRQIPPLRGPNYPIDPDAAPEFFGSKYWAESVYKAASGRIQHIKYS